MVRPGEEGGGGLTGAADRQEEAWARPAVGLMGEFTLLPAWLAAERRPLLLGQELLQVSDSRQNKIVNLNNMKRLLRKKLFVDYLCANQHNDASCLKF